MSGGSEKTGRQGRLPVHRIEEGREAGVDPEDGEPTRLGEADGADYHVGWISPDGHPYESYVEYLISTIMGEVYDEEAAHGSFYPPKKLLARATELVIDHVPDEYLADVTDGVAKDISVQAWLRGFTNPRRKKEP